MEPDDKEIIKRLVISGIDQLAKVFKYLWREQSNSLGLSPIQAEILRRISKIPKELNTIGRIAHDLNVTAGTISESVRALEQKGLVNRVRSSSDARVQYVIPTQKGIKIAERIEDVYVPLAKALSRMSETELSEGLNFLGKCIHTLQDVKILPLDSACETCPYRTSGGVKTSKHICSFTYLAESWGHFCLHLADEKSTPTKQEVKT